MSLSVRQAEADWPKEEYDVMHGEWQLGRVSHAPDSPWCWTLGGIAGGPNDLVRAGVAASLPEARTQIDDQWNRWLTYAQLEPIEANVNPSNRQRPDQP